MIKFAVFSDLHYDHIHDGDKRIDFFIEQVQSQNIDFVIELGDFVYPENQNKKIIQRLEVLNVPLYFVLGNHDSDVFPREQVMEFLKMDKSYYSFSMRNTKFIVLDSCYIKTANGCEPYLKRNYSRTTDVYPYIPENQSEWLQNELNDDSQYYVIFSHHSLKNEFQKRGIGNKEEVQDVINTANNRGKKVILCMNGHDHGSDISTIGDTYYYTLNAMSYIWVGSEYEHFNYSEETHEKYPYLKDLILYGEGLYAIVSIYDNGNFEIVGMQGHYQNVSPKELGMGDSWNGCSIKPIVPSIQG